MCVKSSTATLHFAARFRKSGQTGKTGSMSNLNEGEDLVASLQSARIIVLTRVHGRLAHLWFLIGCVVCIKTGNIYDTSQSYRSLELPCPKSLWEAPTQTAWESECEATRTFQMNGLHTVGDLIDAQQSSHISSSARKLDQWNARVDSLGCLSNLVGDIL